MKNSLFHLISAADLQGLSELAEQGLFSGLDEESRVLIRKIVTAKGRLPDLLPEGLAARADGDLKGASLLCCLVEAAFKLREPENRKGVLLQMSDLVSWGELETSQFVDCVRMVMISAPDEELSRSLARSWLSEGERKCSAVWEWRNLAEAWMEFFVDRARAGRCLHRARFFSDRSCQFVQCAQAWKEILDDEGAARRDLGVAEALMEHGYEWRDCALAWLKILGDHRRARFCLAASFWKDSAAGNAVVCARELLQNFGDEEGARFVLENAEVGARSWDPADLSSAWKQHFDDDVKAREDLDQAERQARWAYDWQRCAQAALITGEKERTRAFIERLEETALKEATDGVRDFLAAAALWKDLDDSEERVRKALLRAEGFSEKSGEWIDCALSWRLLCADEEGFLRCITAGTSYAVDSGDWMRLGDAFLKELHAVEKTRECYGRAQALAEDCSDFLHCADGWLRLHMKAEAWHCLSEGEGRIAGVYDALWVARRAWVWRGEGDRARQALKEAEARCHSGVYWSVVVRWWIAVFDNLKEAKRCLKHAEESIGREDGRALARIFRLGPYSLLWWTCFDDRRESARCLAEIRRLGTRRQETLRHVGLCHAIGDRQHVDELIASWRKSAVSSLGLGELCIAMLLWGKSEDDLRACFAEARRLAEGGRDVQRLAVVQRIAGVI